MHELSPSQREFFTLNTADIQEKVDELFPGILEELQFYEISKLDADEENALRSELELAVRKYLVLKQDIDQLMREGRLEEAKRLSYDQIVPDKEAVELWFANYLGVDTEEAREIMPIESVFDDDHTWNDDPKYAEAEYGESPEEQVRAQEHIGHLRNLRHRFSVTRKAPMEDPSFREYLQRLRQRRAEERKSHG